MNPLRKHAGRAICVALALCAAAPLAAIDLNDLMTLAKQNSTQLQTYALTRKNSELTNELTKVEDTVSVSVSSGNATVKVNPETTAKVQGVTVTIPSNVSTSVSPEVTIGIPVPNSTNKTTISIGMPTSMTFSSDDSQEYSVTPTIGASHSFTFGNTGDDRSDLLYSQNVLMMDMTYASNILTFENQVYAKISSILSMEQQIRTASKNIADLELSISNALTLGTYTKDSVAYLSKELSLNSLQNNLRLLQLNYKNQLDQFKLFTGQDYEQVTGIRKATLTMNPLSNGNTNVVLAQLALEVAQENLKIEQATLTNRSLLVNGSIGVPVTTNVASGANSNTTSMTIGAGATYSGSNFSAGASTSMDYNITSNKFTPSVTISGKWTNNANATSTVLKLQQLENKVLQAQITYNDELLSYNTSAVSLQSDIEDWNLKVVQLQNQMDYDQQVLLQKQELLKIGLGKQSDVDAAQFTVDDNQFDYARLLLDGLVLENKIRMLQL